MRALVVGTTSSRIDGAAEHLRRAGHEVVRCHDPGDASFPCAGLVEERGCPLEQAPVDVVVTSRGRSWLQPSAFETGAACALRQHVPLVILGSEVHPYKHWGATLVANDDELVTACESAAAAPLPRHGELAVEVAQHLLDRAGIDSSRVTATVRHQHGRLAAQLTVPPLDERLQSNLVARVATELRIFDRHALGIDISVTEHSVQ